MEGRLTVLLLAFLALSSFVDAVPSRSKPRQAPSFNEESDSGVPMAMAEPENSESEVGGPRVGRSSSDGGGPDGITCSCTCDGLPIDDDAGSGGRAGGGGRATEWDFNGGIPNVQTTTKAPCAFSWGASCLKWK